jgi:hypothetical protein
MMMLRRRLVFFWFQTWQVQFHSNVGSLGSFSAHEKSIVWGGVTVVERKRGQGGGYIDTFGQI